MTASDPRAISMNHSQDESADLQKSSKRKWSKRLLYFFVFALLLYPLSILVMNSSWAKSKITTKVGSKTGMEWKVGSLYWVPFGDFYINDLQTVSQHEQGGVKIESISFSPIWRQLVKGSVVWDEILLDGVDMDVEKEWLEMLMEKGDTANVPKLKPDPIHKTAKKVAPKKTPAQKPNVAKKKPLRREVPKPPIEKKEPIVKVLDKTLRVKGLNLKLREENKIWYELNNVTMNLPLAGSSRSGEISVEEKSGQKTIIPVNWNGKFVQIESDEVELFGVKMSIQSQIDTFSRSKKFRYQVTIKKQPFHYELQKPNLNVRAKAKSIDGGFVLGGNILSPQTWSGVGRIQLNQLSIEETRKTHKKLLFDEVRAQGRMLQGHLLVDDARASSDYLSFMANGVIAKNSYCYGVFRCVANEEYNMALLRIHHGSRALRIDDSSYHLFEKLETADRKFFDIYFDGKIKQLEMKHNRSNHWQSFNVFLENLRKFKDRELREDGLFESE